MAILGRSDAPSRLALWLHPWIRRTWSIKQRFGEQDNSLLCTGYRSCVETYEYKTRSKPHVCRNNTALTNHRSLPLFSLFPSISLHLLIVIDQQYDLTKPTPPGLDAERRHYRYHLRSINSVGAFHPLTLLSRGKDRSIKLRSPPPSAPSHRSFQTPTTNSNLPLHPLPLLRFSSVQYPATNHRVTLKLKSLWSNSGWRQEGRDAVRPFVMRSI